MGGVKGRCANMTQQVISTEAKPNKKPETATATSGQTAPETPPQTASPVNVNAALTATPSQSGDGDRALNAFASEANFKGGYRIANALSQSTLVPDAYRGNVPNCLIAIELASRIGASVLMVMQSLDIVHGRPSWRAQFLIATVNSSGKFTPIRFRWQGKESSDDWGCRAWAKDKETGEECVGTLITIKIAKDEQWYDRKGSKWRTIPEQMLMYRAAAFWARIYCPELSLGMQTAEEVIDTVGVPVSMVETPAALTPGSPKALEAALLGHAPASVANPVAVDSDGVVVVNKPQREMGED